MYLLDSKTKSRKVFEMDIETFCLKIKADAADRQYFSKQKKLSRQVLKETHFDTKRQHQTTQMCDVTVNCDHICYDVMV